MSILRVVKWLFRLLTGGALRGLGGKALGSVVDSLIGRDGTGLQALLAKFNAGGLGDVAQSWVGKGANKPVSVQQVQSTLGSETISGIADQMGTSPETAASKVAKILPRLIDRLTPDGLVPDPEALSQRLAGLLKR